MDMMYVIVKPSLRKLIFVAFAQKVDCCFSFEIIYERYSEKRRLCRKVYLSAQPVMLMYGKIVFCSDIKLLHLCTKNFSQKPSENIRKLFILSVLHNPLPLHPIQNTVLLNLFL